MKNLRKGKSIHNPTGFIKSLQFLVVDEQQQQQRD